MFRLSNLVVSGRLVAAMEALNEDGALDADHPVAGGVD